MKSMARHMHASWQTFALLKLGMTSCLQDPWGRVQWLWDRPPVKRLRITISMAQWTVRLPALLALIATQVVKMHFILQCTSLDLDD